MTPVNILSTRSFLGDLAFDAHLPGSLLFILGWPLDGPGWSRGRAYRPGFLAGAPGPLLDSCEHSKCSDIFRHLRRHRLALDFGKFIVSLPDFCCIAACPLSLRKLLCYFAHQVQPPSCPPWLWPPQVEVSLYGTAAASRVSRPLQQFVHCCNLGFVWRRHFRPQYV